MTMIRLVVPAAVSTVADDEVAVVMSTAALARDGHVLVPQGCRLDNYLRNPIVLWQHSPDQPIGNAENIQISQKQITARIRFAPLGCSQKADEIRALMKAGVVRAVSVGFDPIDMEPLRQGGRGQRITSWELLELSAVSVPADAGAMVTERALRAGKVLSGANADAVRQAHDMAEQCRSTLAGVLDGAGETEAQRDFRRRQAEALQLENELFLSDMGVDLKAPPERQRRQLDLAVLRLDLGRGDDDYARRQREAAALSLANRD